MPSLMLQPIFVVADGILREVGFPAHDQKPRYPGVNASSVKTNAVGLINILAWQ